jgi:hypothetical protein
MPPPVRDEIARFPPYPLVRDSGLTCRPIAVRFNGEGLELVDAFWPRAGRCHGVAQEALIRPEALLSSRHSSTAPTPVPS